MTVYKNDLSVQIKESINSVLNQKGVDFHLCIGIDGHVSSDIMSTLNLYTQNERVTIRHFAVNRGLAATLNDLISEHCSKFEFTARMDADDICFDTRLKRQVDFLLQNRNIDVLGTGCVEFANSDDIIFNENLKNKVLPSSHLELSKLLFTRSSFVHPSVMFRSSVFVNENIRYPTNLHLSEDLGLWCLLVSKGFKFANIQEPLLYFRLNNSTIFRRRGLRKAISELSARRYLLTFWNSYLFLGSILVFLTRLLPAGLLKILYRLR